MSEEKSILSPAVAEINELTYALKERMWFENLGVNLPVIRSGRDILELTRWEGKPAIVIGAGQSVQRFNHLELLAKSNLQNFLVIATDRMLVSCLKKGITPDLVVSSDGDPIIAKFYNDPIVPKYKDRVKAVFNEIVHPKTVKKCPYEKYFYISLKDDPTEKKSITRIIHWMLKKTMMPSLGNSGADSWNIGLFLGASPMIIVGIDYSYPPDTPLEKTIYYKAYVDLAQKTGKKLEDFYGVITNPQSGEKLMIDYNWNAYARIFMHYAEKTPVETWNCSPISSLYGERVKYVPLEEALRRFKG